MSGMEGGIMRTT